VEFLIRRFWFLDLILQWSNTLDLTCSRCVLLLSLWGLYIFFSLRTWLGINCSSFSLHNVGMRNSCHLWQLSKLISVSCPHHSYGVLYFLPAFLLFGFIYRRVTIRLMAWRLNVTFRCFLSNNYSFNFISALIFYFLPFLIFYICINFWQSCALYVPLDELCFCQRLSKVVHILILKDGKFLLFLCNC
jgi:hypothetical protein